MPFRQSKRLREGLIAPARPPADTFRYDWYTLAGETVPKPPPPHWVRRVSVAGRRTGGLIRFWVAVLVIGAGLYWIGRTIPAARNLLALGYWILAAFALFFTVRWYRPRHGDRRHGDRREREDQ